MSALDRIKIVQGDITTLDVDAIVNAARPSLLGGGGVDGAIHKAAGPGLLAECMTLNGCPTGDAVITGGYNLPARNVIHTVGPVWKGGSRSEDDLLASSYRSALRLAAQNGLLTVAFPSISTGAYGFPLERAAPIAMREIARFLSNDDGSSIEEVTMVCFGKEAFDAYSAVLERMKHQMPSD